MKNIFLHLSLLLLFLFMPFCSLWGQEDVVTADSLRLTGSYDLFTDLKCSSTVIYAVGAAESDKGALQFRKVTNSQFGGGLVTTFSNNKIKSIKIEWSAGESSGPITIYGKNSAYDCNECFKYNNRYSWGDKQATISRPNSLVSVCDLSQKDYQYIGIRAEDNNIARVNRIIIEWQKLKRNLNFTNSFYEVKENSSFEAPKLNGVVDGVIFSSSDESVATVDALSGKVTVVGCGTTTIKALAEESSQYQAEEASYTLMVKSNRAPVEFTFDFQNDKSLLPEGTLPAVFSIMSGDAEVIFREGKTPSTYNSAEGKFFFGADATAEINVPNGFKLERVSMAVTYLSLKPGVEKEETPRQCIYRVIDPEGVRVKTITASYDGTYKLKLGSTGIATFSAAQAYKLPEGLKGGTVSVDETKKVAYVKFCVQPNDVVASKEALLIQGTPGEYTLLPSEEQGVSFGSDVNRLRPILTNLEVLAPKGNNLYVLSRKNEQLGFYWQKGSTEGDKVQHIANKAYLELPAVSAVNVQGYRLDWGEYTGVEEIRTTENVGAGVFTLTGVRVDEPIEQLPSGVYIIKGKKIYVK